VDVPHVGLARREVRQPPGASVVPFTFAGRITQVGVEDIRFECPPRDATHQFSLMRADAIADGWVRRVAVHNFTNGNANSVYRNWTWVPADAGSD
jgi:hypothetical protein